MKRVLVVGGTNCVGPHIINNLLKDKHDITVITRGNRNISFDNKVNHVIADVSTDKLLKSKLDKACYDVIIDCVATDCNTVDNLLKQIQTGRYIQISTIGVYDYSKASIKEEEFASVDYDLMQYYKSCSHSYGDKKRSAEAIAFQKYSDYNPVSLRPAYVTDINNPFHTQNVRLWEMMRWVKRGIHISHAINDYDCTFTLASDEAELIIKLLDCKHVGAVNVASKNSLTVGEIISICEKISGCKAIMDDNGKIPEFRGRKKIDISLYKELIGKEPNDLNEWIEELLKMYEKSNYIIEGTWADVFNYMKG